jgi:hypothetical protein
LPNKHFHRLPPLRRRTLLRGALGGGVGVALGLPTLEAMLNSQGTAYAQDGAFPKRFGFYFWGDGVRLEHWNPATTGAGFALSTSLMPLSNVKDHVSVVSGTEVRMRGQGHHTGQAALATGSPYIQQDAGGAPYASTFKLPSIDQVIATAWKVEESTPFRSLELGISSRLNKNEGTTLNFFSHNGPDNPNAPERDPKAVFTRLFTTGFVPGTTEPMGPDPRWALRKSVLDVVRQGAADLKGRIGRTDQIRVDQHLESIRGIENKITALEQGGGPLALSCTAPTEPGAIPKPQSGEPLIEITDALSDLLAVALACDLTRVFTISFSCGVSFTTFPEIGINTGRHGLSHDEGADQPGMQASTVFIIERLATFMEKLKAVTEGPGTLLDNCAVMASSDVSEGLPHSLDDYPVLVIGSAGGGLAYPGVHHRSDGQNTSDIHFSVLSALGVPVTSFGGEEGESSTVIPELMA